MIFDDILPKIAGATAVNKRAITNLNVLNEGGRSVAAP